ncbi:MAG: hypothetical protein COU63_02875 [Candidatus Pacebacteria bacterium CG10_big_fil_rev_8_21_14_0_10_36_11]|nr:hypothetical protein [Candidatus Pacearchaeota archaeon]OIP74373.1 MAG: hypothetical protein AUK08_01135 [Candidatus Pacebacteria bacterium CG2_30_36_39]PIR64936.1 MAG: hypothetical protein COU63_02875 [Candidatus Pacebacteria bacterium CG10_big_fil_rev_8_21_14_0_10_36_11]PJC42766.1 MAG: hypothetical protein CO040_02765 [Candidatus Pacebacteria bacterium CG_4_9_14_0_2_um_filter_36_8]
MKKILFSLLLIFVLIIGFLSYIGVVPFISPLITKPKDLGIKADPALVAAFDIAHEMKNELPDGKIPADREPEYEGSKKLDIKVSSAEITSILAYWKNQYSKSPIRDVQVRINDDGTGEVSGILELSTAIMLAKQLDYSDEDIEKGKSYVKYVAGDLPFYMTGVANVKNNQVTLSPTTVEIGRVALPESLVAPVSSAVADVIERRMSKVTNLDVQELTLEPGGVHLVGTIPDTVK